MKSSFRPIFPILFLVAGLLGCAASQPPSIVLRPARKPPPDPEALGYFIDAKRFEMKGERGAAVNALYAAIDIDSTSATLYGALSRNLNALRRFSEAVAPARRAVRLDPRNLENRRHFYHALMEGPKDTTAAVKQLEAITRIAPNPLAAYDGLLKIYAAQNRRDDVLRTVDRVLTIPSLNTRGQIFAAETYMRTNVPERASAVYRQVLAQNPRQANIWGRLGSIALTVGDTLKAEGIYREGLTHFQNRINRLTAPIWRQLFLIYDSDTYLEGLISETPLDTTFVEHLAKIVMDLARRPENNPKTTERRYNRAEILLDHLIHANPSRHDLLARKGYLLLNTNRPEEARATFGRAYKQDPKAEYWLGIGHTYLSQGRKNKALTLFQALYEKAPTNSPLYPQIVSELGRLYRAIGQMADARGVYAKAAEADTSRPEYRFELGYTYASEKAWEKAIPIFEALLDRVGDDSELFRRTLLELAQSYERAGRFDSAVAEFQRLITLDPDNHRALNNLGYMLAEKGIRLNEAERLIERALRAEPKNGAYLDSMGWVYYRQGRYDEAMEYLDRALKVEEAELQNHTDDDRYRASLYENLAVIYDHAGDAARALGDLNKARRHWKRASRFNPDNAAIHQKLQTFTAPVGNAPAGPE